MRGRADYLFARYVWLRINQGHYVLQLIAKTERAARLIKCRASSHATGKGLIKQPAVYQHVHRNIRSFDFDYSQQLIPKIEHPLERFVDRMRIAEACIDFPRMLNRITFAKEKNNFPCFMRRQVN